MKNQIVASIATILFLIPGANAANAAVIQLLILCCLLPVVCCLLPVVCCLLPVVCCLLPVAYYLLPKVLKFCTLLTPKVL
ncbi:MAG: hypothetical protein F6K24_10940 [Okeania sp. SIO2D1]|nr:hypothetical protein [Okeania sp. SIO2D1]